MSRSAFRRRCMPLGVPTTLLILAAVAAAFATAAAAPAAHVPDPNQPRSEVPDEYKWDPHHIFPDDAAWEAEVAAIRADFERFAGYQGRLGESADVLHRCLEERWRLDERMAKIRSYASLQLSADQTDPAAQLRSGRVDALWPAFYQAIAFVQPEILALDPAVVDRFLAEHEGLREYAFYVQELRRQASHTLNPEEERILALSSPPRGGYRNLFFALMNADIRYPEIVNEEGERVRLSLPGFARYRASPVYAVRRQAAEGFFGALKANENILASMLDGHVRSHVMMKEARGYASCLEASLDPDGISTEAYLMLIRTINENLGRTLHRYVALRRKVLGLEGPLTFPNLYNSLTAEAELSYTYDEARDMLLAALAPLGKEYLDHLREGLAPGAGWVDIYPNQGKDAGAYSNGSVARDIHPYIKMNYDNSLDAVSTLAHEFGHAVHSIYSRHTQPLVYGDYTTFLAEVASTCNEELLLSYLLERTDDVDTKLYLLGTRLENIRLTIFRQTLFAEFELRFHERAENGDPLTAEWLNETYRGLIETYYGPEFAMNEVEEVEWGFISQFWRNYYVFAYATGMTSGISLADQILDGGERAARRYVDNLLKGGGSAPPLDILRAAGVDLETPRPILDMLDLFEKTVAEYDRIWTEEYGRS